MPSIIKSLALLALVSTATAAGFDAHQGAHPNRGLAHRHRANQHQARAPEPSKFVDLVARAGAAYNETDHDSTASIEIGGAQTSSAVASVGVSSAAVSSSVVPVTSSSAGVSSVVSSAVVSSAVSAVPSATSTSSVGSTAVVTSSSSSSIASSTIASSSITPSSSSSASDSSSTLPSSSTTPTDPVSSTASQIISTVRSTITDSSAAQTTTPSETSRSAKTGSISIKTASASSTATLAAAVGGTTTGMSGGTKTAIIVVCVVGGIALGAFALWTIVRRWKLRPSQRFDGRMKPLDFSPTSPDAFYEKTMNRHNSTSSADRQRRQFVDELDEEVYDHHVHAQQYDMTGMEGGAALAGGGVASSYPHQESYAHEDEGYLDLRRGPSLTHGAPTQTFAGVGAGGGASFPSPGMTYPQHQGSEYEYRDDGSDGYHGHASPQGLAREPSLGRPTRGEGPYAAAQFAGAGARY